MKPEIIVPLIMGCALLWFIGRGVPLRLRLIAAIVTLALIALVLFVERAMS